MTLWRIATEAREYSACDATGMGAELHGGRWNEAGVPVVYAAPTQALAVLEMIVHLDGGQLPMNRYVVGIDVPVDVWDRRLTLDLADAPPGWDAVPEGQASIGYGTRWLVSCESALMLVPSTVVPMEQNVLINPRHGDAAAFTFKTLQRFNFDARLQRQRLG